MQSISGHIDVHMGRNENYRAISSNCSFFENADYYLFKEVNNTLVIKKLWLDIPKHALKVHRRGDGFFTFTLSSKIPIGRLHFDEEESNEDVAIIYFKS